MARGVPEEKFIEVVVNSDSREAAANELGISVSAVNVRICKLVDNGKLIRNGRSIELPKPKDKPKELEAGTTDEKVTESTECKPHKTWELGNKSATNPVKIDVSSSEEGLRLFKKKGVMERLDSLMALMEDTDTYEIKNMFKQLAVKIFENSLK